MLMRTESTPSTIIATAATNAVAPAAADPPKIASPAANSITPAPIAAQAMPSKAIAPLKANIDGMTGVKTVAANPITANAAAIAIRLLIIAPILIDPRAWNTGTSIFKAAAITTKAAADVSILPFATPAKRAKPDAKASITVIAVPALSSESHSILPNLLHTSANISIAAPINTNATADFVTCFDIPANNIKPEDIAKMENIAVSALSRLSTSMLPSLEQTLANISIAAPIITSAIADFITCFDIPASFINPPDIARIAVIAAPALPSDSQSIPPSLELTLAKISMAAPIMTKAVADFIICFGLMSFSNA